MKRKEAATAPAKGQRWTPSLKLVALLHNGDVIAELFNRPLAECQSAALLIAAAPALAEALRTCERELSLTTLGGCSNLNTIIVRSPGLDAIKAARTALALVEGRVE